MSETVKPSPVTGLRKIQVGQSLRWYTVRMATIKKGDVFRMFEPDGTPVIDSEGRSMWRASTDAHLVYPRYYQRAGDAPLGYTENDELPPGTLVSGVEVEDQHLNACSAA